MRGRQLRLWIGAIFLLWCAAASALSHGGSIRDLRYTAWGSAEGAPDLIVALAQTSDGYLWAGSASGLYRFDGVQFERVELPRDGAVTSANVFSLHAPASGGLWVGFSLGGAAFLKDGTWSTYGERDGLLPGSVKSIARDQDGSFWAGTTSGLAHFDGTRWRKIGEAENYRDTKVESVLVDSTGTLWVASRSRVSFLVKGTRFFQESGMRPKDSDGLSGGFAGLAESTTGAIWLVTIGGTAYKLRHDDKGPARAGISGRFILFDRDGSLWTFGTNAALNRVSNPNDLDAPTGASAPRGSDWFSEKDGLIPGEGYGAMLQDREGNVWIATGTGLARFSEKNVTQVLPSPDRGRGTYGGTTSLAAADRGDVWVNAGTLKTFTLGETEEQHDAEVNDISCAIRSNNGTLWVANDKAIWNHAAGRFTRTALPDGTDGFQVQAMAEDRSGGLWVSIVRKGVFRLAGGAWTSYGGIPELPRLTAMSLMTDSNGRVWFGYTEGRAALIDGNNVSVFAGAARLSVGNVSVFYGQRGRVWAGGEFGLELFDGTHFRPVVSDSGMPFNHVTGIVETADGDLWVNYADGIFHMKKEEADHAFQDPKHAVRGELFDKSDEVRGTSARLRPLPTAIEGTDGRLWFTRSSAAYMIDPARIFRNSVPASVVIRSLVVNEKAYLPTTGLRLPERTTSIRIDYVGLSLTTPEKVRYRYRLSGVDADWRDARARRQAYYTDLAPGSYRFQVTAANNDGVWNVTGATVDFVIPPAFVQTGWFVALCALGAGVIIWLLIRFRVQQVALTLRIRHGERLAERERIARELHDTLLQSTQSLVLRFQAAARDLPDQDPTRLKLEQTLDGAEVVMAEGRDRVLDLRVAAYTLQDLPQALTAIGEELAQGSKASFRTLVEGSPRKLERAVNDEAYRIGREALLNAFRHAEAKAVEVQITYADQNLCVRVRDDGLGIDADALAVGSRPGHWGLPGMRERAQQISARFEVWSRPGAGTEIELLIPAPVAYGQRALRSRWLNYLRVATGER